MSLPAGVTVRRARPGDASHVFTLVEQLGYTPDHRGFDETFAQTVRHPEAAVVRRGRRAPSVIGYLSMSHRPQIRLGGRSATYIDEMAVDDKRRAQGVGSALIKAAVEYARGLGCKRIDLNTSRTRPSYHRGFYVSHGFGEVDSAVMRLALTTRSKP